MKVAFIVFMITAVSIVYALGGEDCKVIIKGDVYSCELVPISDLASSL